MKFGGGLLTEPASYAALAEQIISRRASRPQVVAVVSAMGGVTDELLALAAKVHPTPPPRELDMLVSAGERISMALLAMALARLGARAISLTGSQSGLITCPRHSDARIIDVRPTRLKKHLDSGELVIVAGFQGVSETKEITTLGRGGSDTTAVALAVALGGDVEFYKDVGGIFTSDPKRDPDAQPLRSLTFDEAFKRFSGHRPIHPRALALAAANALPLQILGLGEGEGTEIGHREERGAVYEAVST